MVARSRLGLALQLAQPVADPPRRAASSSSSFAISSRRPADELELAVEVRGGLLEHVAPADRVLDAARATRAQRRRGPLGRRELAELLERDAEQRLEPQHLAEALDVGVVVEAVGAGLARGPSAQQADLLVVADRARGGARAAGRPRRCAALARLIRRAQRRALCRAAGLARSDSSGSWRGRRRRHARADQRGRGEHPERDVHVVDERVELRLREAAPVTPEKISNRTSFGTAAVTIASTNAIEITAPVFCSIVRAPAAIPRRSAGTVPIIAAVFGELNMPEPMPTRSSQSALSQ